MYFSKKINFLLIILIANIFLLKAHYVRRNVAHGASMRSEYIEGLLKLKSRMLANAMETLNEKQGDPDDVRHRQPGEQKKVFNDLGSHPIATPRTLHAEDFTMPSMDMFTKACTTTPEPEPVTAATSRMQYHRPNLNTTPRSEGREEETITRKHDLDVEEVTHPSNETDYQRKDENHEEEIVTRKQEMEVEEVTQKCNKTKIHHGNENSEEETITRKHGIDAEEVTHAPKETEVETSTHAGDQGTNEGPHAEHETNMEKPECKQQETTTPSSEQEETNESAPKERHDKYSTERTEEYREKSATGKTDEHKPSEPQEEKGEETTTETKQEAEEETEEECTDETEEESGTTCGPDEEEVDDSQYQPPFKFIVIHPTIANSQKEKERTEQEKSHTTTCGPDEEEVEEEEFTYRPRFRFVIVEPTTADPKGSSTTQTSAKRPSTKRPSETESNMPTNRAAITTPSSPIAYQTMCFPVTEANGPKEVTTQAYPMVPSSNGTQGVATQQATTSPSPTEPPITNSQKATTLGYPGTQGHQVTQGYPVTPGHPVTQGYPVTTGYPVPQGYQVTQACNITVPTTAAARTNEASTTRRPANATTEGTTQSLIAYATMCFPITEPPKQATSNTRPTSVRNAPKKRRFHKQRRQSRNNLLVVRRPSMRTTLRRVVRELKERESKPVDTSKMLTLVHFAGQPRYQRYYLRGLKHSSSSSGNHKIYENADYPDEENDPKLVRGSKSVVSLAYEQPNEDDQSAIFEDAMKVKVPFCPTKAPPPQLMADKCAGKNHKLQHFSQAQLKSPPKPVNLCKKPCEDDLEVSAPIQFIMPIAQIGNQPNNSCRKQVDDDFDMDNNFSTDTLLDNNFGDASGCGLGIQQLKKKSKAEISLENFRKEQENDPIQQKLSFMGRLLGRTSKCGNTNKPPNELPNEFPSATPKSVSPLQRIFGKWLKSKPNCDKCHQKAKLKDILHRRTSIKQLNEGNSKYRRQNSRLDGNINLQKSKGYINSELDIAHAFRRRKTACENKSNKAAKNVGNEQFVEVVKPRRQSIMRMPRHIREESNSRVLDWQDMDVPDLSFSWEGNVDIEGHNMF